MRSLVLLLLTLLLIESPLAAAQAQDSDEAALYRVSDIAVDVTADSATHARDQALSQAERLAFQQLLERLGVDTAPAAKLSDTDIAGFVRSFEVQQERLSAVRYIGTYTIGFKAPSVRAFLGQKGISFSEVRSKPVLIFPVVKTPSRTILWEEKTPWRAAWEAFQGQNALVPVVIPSGDIDDVAASNGTDASQGKVQGISSLLAKYQAGNAAVAVLNLSAEEGAFPQDLRVDLQTIDAAGMAGSLVHFTLPSAPDAKGFEEEIKAGLKQISSELEGNWQKTAKAPQGPLAHLSMISKIESLGAWSKLKGKLKTMAVINKINVLSLTRGEARLELEFHGDIASLQQALSLRGLSLTEESEGWILTDAPSN